MTIQTILLFAVMGFMLLGVGFLIFKFVGSIKEKRAYEREELPDLDAIEEEDDVLPDIDESSFSRLGTDFANEEESASEIYRDIYSDTPEGRGR